MDMKGVVFLWRERGKIVGFFLIRGGQFIVYDSFMTAVAVKAH